MENEDTHKLEFIFSNINQQLRFAETKNTTILTSNLALVTIYFISFSVKLQTTIHLALAINFLIMMACSILIASLSLFSRTIVFDKLFGGTGELAQGKNTIYFGHIARMNKEIFLKHIFPKKQQYSVYANDLAHQIVANSRIASKKFKMFNISLWFFIAAFTTPIGAYLLVNLLSDEAI